VLLLGIGGSALGPQLVDDALSKVDEKIKLHFCDNTDPNGIARTLKRLEGSFTTTLNIVISKSGGTVETANAMLEVQNAYEKQGVPFAPHAVAVTCAGSKLDRIAEGQKWLQRLEMWDWVGGRTSLFSAVGILPAALQGVDVDAFVEGAREMDAATRAEAVRQNPAALLALAWHFEGGGKGKKDMVILPYKDRLVLFSKYLQQLVMESLGKEKDLNGSVVHQGIAVYGNKGSTDQHAYVQQLRDGVNNFFATFIEVLEDDGEASPLMVKENITSGDYLNGFFQGTRRALYENQRDSVTITVDRLDARTLGALIALYERAVGFYASLVGINAYHQPGVEAGKKAAEAVVEIQQKILKLSGISGKTAEQIAASIGAGPEVETVYKVLCHLAANGRATKSTAGNPRETSFSLK
jgi:glucose-6-phosphate isomerase